MTYFLFEIQAIEVDELTANNEYLGSLWHILQDNGPLKDYTSTAQEPVYNS